MKRIICALLAAIMLLGAMPLTAFAADWGEGDTLDDALAELKVGFDDTLLDWLVLPNLGVIYQRYAYFLYDNERTGTVDEHPVYCIDPTKGGAYEIVRDVGPNDDGSNTATYIRGEKVGDAKYKAILSAGYPHMRLAGLGLETVEEGYYATKLALWMYIRGNDATKLTINPKYGNSDPVALRVYNAAITIYKNGTTGSGVVEPALTLTPKSGSTAKLDAGGEYYVQEIEVYASGWVGTNPDACGDVQLSWQSAPPAGTIVLGSNGEDITSTLNVEMTQSNGWRGKITVKYPAASVDPTTFSPSTLVATAIVPNNEMYVAYAKVNGDKYQRYLVESDPKIKLEAAFISQISWEPEQEFPSDSGLRIRKLEAGTTNPLSGAVFEVLDPDGKLIFSGATDSSGIIDIPLAVAGNYTVTEVIPPQYHLLSENRTQSITVRYGEIAEVAFTNDPYGTLRVMKRDAANGAPLNGATIQIKHIATGVTRSATTDSSGNVVFDKLPVGAYEISELSSPSGYELAIGTHTVNVTSAKDGEVSYSLTNKAKAGLRIYKFDKQAMTPIAGVTFEVYRDGELYGSYVTDNWGEITLTNLPSGTYTAKEVATPAPYVLDPTVQWVEIRAGQGYISELVFLNLVKPGIRLVKLDSETLAPLPNARYEIAHVGGSYKNEFVTDANGEIDLSGLEPGAYTVRELAAPSNYLIDDAVRTVQINAGENAQFVFTNTKKPTIEIIKYDAQNGVFVPGATIRIAKIEDGTNYLDRITDINGKISISGLEPGVYSVREVAAPGDYVLNEREYHVELFPGKTSQLVIENVKKPSLIIWKYDMQTAETLPDTEFSVAKKGGSVIYEGVTNGDGYIRLDNLDEGWYTITELAPAPGYLAVTESKDVYLEAGKTAHIKFDNLKCPTLTINKIDSITRDGLAGVRFNIKFCPEKSFDGGVVDLGDFTTDENGQIIMNDNLGAGWYRATELAALEGYTIADPAVQDIFLAGGQNKTLTFENVPKSAIIIRKVDSDTGLPVQGATFEVRYLGGTSGSSGTIIKTVVTSVNGTATIAGLAPGTYVVEETIPAKSYELSNPSVQTAYIADNEQAVVELVFSNAKMGHLVIQKYDSATKLPLAGVTFKVTGSSGAVIGPNNGLYTTDATGVIAITEYLPIGSTVTVTEVSGPDTHNLDAPAQSVKIKENTTHTLSFYNSPKSGMQIIKIDSVTKQPIKGVQFRIYKANGEVVGDYETDKDGLIIVSNLAPGWYKAVETKAVSNYVLDDTPKDFEITNNQFVKLTFENVPYGGIQITKLDEETKKPIAGVQFSVTKMNGERISANNYTTDKNGVIRITGLDDGWYTITEEKAADTYLLDATPHNVEVKNGSATPITITNRKESSILLHKTDSVTGKGIYGVKFLISDGSGNPIRTETTDQNGYIYTTGLADGKYFIRELEAAPGYYLDPQVKTFYIRYGATATIEWTNTPQMGQIQIAKKSGDDNEVNGLPAGTPLANAIFEVYEYKSGNLVDCFISGSDGRAVSKPLPLGRYIVKEVQAPQWYQLSTQTLDIELEFATQIVKAEFLNYSANTGVYIKKTGVYECMPGDTIRYDIKAVQNTSTVPLTDFYWRDILPTDAVRLSKIVTGTFNQSLKYKVVATTNKGDTRVIADNLSTTKNNVIDCSNASLGLKSDEYVTSITFFFGTVKAGFAQVEQPQIYVKTLTTLQGGYQFANKADVGGKYGSEWVVGNTTWLTTIYKKPVPLPRTGY